MIHEEVSLPSLETHVRTTRSEGSAAWFLPSFGINSTGMMYRTNETKLKFPDPYPTQKQGCFKLSMRLSSFHVPCPLRTCTWTHAIDEQLCERSLTEESYYLLLDTSKYPPYHTSIITSIIICNSSTHLTPTRPTIPCFFFKDDMIKIRLKNPTSGKFVTHAQEIPKHYYILHI